MSDGELEQLDAVRVRADVGEVEKQFDEVGRSPRAYQAVFVLGLRFQAFGGRSTAWVVGETEYVRVLE